MSRSARVRLLVRQSTQPLPGDDAWLAAAESAHSARFRIDKRRFEWRLGRITAKRLIAAELGLPPGRATLARIEVRAAEDGAPEPFLDDRPLALTLSISHSTGLAVCAIAREGVALGCDVELIRALRRGTVGRHFTPGEQRLLEGVEPHDWAVRGTLVWTAKESALKALRQGLRLDTRTVEAEPSFDGAPGGWHGLSVGYLSAGRVFRGWWRRTGDHVISLVADPGADPPAGEEAPPHYLTESQAAS